MSAFRQPYVTPSWAAARGESGRRSDVRYGSKAAIQSILGWNVCYGWLADIRSGAEPPRGFDDQRNEVSHNRQAQQHHCRDHRPAGRTFPIRLARREKYDRRARPSHSPGGWKKEQVEEPSIFESSRCSPEQPSDPCRDDHKDKQAREPKRKHLTRKPLMVEWEKMYRTRSSSAEKYAQNCNRAKQ